MFVIKCIYFQAQLKQLTNEKLKMFTNEYQCAISQNWKIDKDYQQAGVTVQFFSLSERKRTTSGSYSTPQPNTNKEINERNEEFYVVFCRQRVDPSLKKQPVCVMKCIFHSQHVPSGFPVINYFPVLTHRHKPLLLTP